MKEMCRLIAKNAQIFCLVAEDELLTMPEADGYQYALKKYAFFSSMLSVVCFLLHPILH